MAYRLLLMDDSVTIRRVVELTFAGEDVQVTTVGDGRAAMERIEADPPDIVLADVGTAKPDGYEVASFVKNHPALAHIPVLLLSGAFQPIDQARAREARCDGVLAKPFELQSVIARVKALLDLPAMQHSEVDPPQTDGAEAGPPPGGDGAGSGGAKLEATAVALDEYLGWLEELHQELPPALPAAAPGPGSNGTIPSPSPEDAVAHQAGSGPSPQACCLDDFFDLVDELLAKPPGALSSWPARPARVPEYQPARQRHTG